MAKRSAVKDGQGLTPRMREFVNLILAGKSQAVAWKLAYDKPGATTKVASQKGAGVARNPKVAAEIAGLKQVALYEARKTAVAGVTLGKAYIMRSLHEVAERCMQHSPVLDRHGKQVMVNVAKEGEPVDVRAAYIFDAKGAVNALVPLGRELGMFVERKEVRTGPLPDKSNDDLDADLLLLMRELADVTGQPLPEIASAHGLALTESAHQRALATIEAPTPTPQGGARMNDGAHPDIL